MTIKAPKKLIEVALPLDDINAAAAREKSIRHGHPSTLHLWWARRPLAAARAVLFAQMVNDPGGERGWGRYKGQTKEDAQREREELFAIIRDLVKWENTNNEEVVKRARAEIRKSWRETCELNKGQPGFDPEKLPAFHDPFAGGGTIPLEAQRLGLEAYASDLNPVAVLINKAMIEIPPKFAECKPVGPIPKDEKQQRMTQDWPGATGLAEDVRRYGHWMREEAFKRIGHLYPPVEITAEMAQDPSNPRPDLERYVGKKLTVIAWIWARTVKSPNPAYSHVNVPLASTFVLANKGGKEAYVRPLISDLDYQFTVGHGKPEDFADLKKGTKLPGRANFRCILSGAPIDSKYIKAEGKAGRMECRLMAFVAEGYRERVYLSPSSRDRLCSQDIAPAWSLSQEFAKNSRHMTPWAYGLDTFSDLFTPRQLYALNALVDLVSEVRSKATADFTLALTQRNSSSSNNGDFVADYGGAVAIYLTLFLSRLVNLNNALCQWRSDPAKEHVGHMFTRKAIPMVWDFAEANPFGNSAGGFEKTFRFLPKIFPFFPANSFGVAFQSDARTQHASVGKIVSTDPPYYDNVPYADLSEFFYVWVRRALRASEPDLLAALSTPKDDELVADAFRHGSRSGAERFFLNGMEMALSSIAQQMHSGFPITLYYAFKQSDTRQDNTSSTGWEVFLDAVLRSGLCLSGTWPVRTELGNRTRSAEANALASSIVLVCRQRDADAPAVSRKQFLRQLEGELPEALEAMIGGREGATAVAPVDLAQAAIGPGMAVFSRYSAVLEADGSPMSVRTALTIINNAIDEYFSHAESEMDADTRFCVDWFQQHGFNADSFGSADVLARAKGTSVDGVREAGAVESGGGKVRLLAVNDYAADWDPTTDKRVPVWQACHQMARALNESESAAGALLARMPEKTESIRQLAYRLYTVCERKGWAEEARIYNGLITSWHAIVEASHQTGHKDEQIGMDI